MTGKSRSKRGTGRWGAIVILGLLFTFGAVNNGFAAEMFIIRGGLPVGAVDSWQYIAGIEKGIFSKNGIDLKVKTNIQSGPEGIQIMQAGEGDITLAGITPICAARAKGVPLVYPVLLSGGYHDDRFTSIVTMEGSGVRAGHPEDLKGKHIGVPLGTTPHEYLLTVLAKHNVPLSSVRLTNVKPMDTALALQQKNVDAVCIWEPNITFMLEKIKGAVLVVRNGGYCSANAGVIMMEDFIKKNRKAAKQLVIATCEADQWVRQHPDETAEIATRWVAGLEKDVAAKAVRLFSFDPRILKRNVQGIQDTINFLVDQGKLKEAIDPRSIVDASLINEVMKERLDLFRDLDQVGKDQHL
jgi:sulfonate transport system substrate-binding protein